MKRIALFPGTFDPITVGHMDIVQRATSLFDQIYVSVGINSKKDTMFSFEQRVAWIKKVFQDYPQVKSSYYEGLTIDYCEKIGAKFIIRGIRYVSDFEYEKSILDANRTLNPSIETIILTSEPKYSSVASTIVREIIKHGGDVSKFTPKAVYDSFKKNKNVTK